MFPQVCTKLLTRDENANIFLRIFLRELSDFFKYIFQESGYKDFVFLFDDLQYFTCVTVAPQTLMIFPENPPKKLLSMNARNNAGV